MLLRDLSFVIILEKQTGVRPFSKKIDEAINKIPPFPINYDAFVSAVKEVSKKSIPQDVWKLYIPGMKPELQSMYTEYCCKVNVKPFDNNTTELREKLV